ncbi:MAG: rRNA maturation RNase YbeY [Lachnospiraceae bacterium]|nr:rRNA maturation RNase YbeY [Lachnospiraceae bacterium]
MTFYVENEINAEYPFDIEKTIESAVRTTLKHEQCQYDAEINVLITDAEKMREYNLCHRGIDSTTDVLSFPAVDYIRPADFTIAQEDKNSYFNPETNELMLGDIILCHDKILSQANDYGHSILREFTFLIVHSMLHLLGYDHMNEEDEKLMFLHQNQIMNELGITR